MSQLIKVAVISAMLLFISAFSFAAKAAPMYAVNIAYFDESGTLVGQKIQWCNNKRFSQGNTSSQYQRHDWTPCTLAAHPVSGYLCSGSGETLECWWKSTVLPEGGVAVEGGNLLPPGMTVADSCVITGDCSPQPPQPYVYTHVSQ